MSDLLECYQYIGIEAFIESLESPLTLESNFRSREQFKGGAMGSYAGSPGSWESTKRLWREGWPEGIAEMRKALDELEPPVVMSRKRKAVYSDMGDEFIRDRLMAGHYDTTWRDVKRQNRRAPVPVRLTVDVEAHINVSHGSLFWRGAGCVLLAEALSIAGYPISIVATSGADGMGMAGGRYKQYITVTVKDWETPTYLPTLIATTGHGAFLRVGVFAHNIQKMPGSHTGGMGYSLNTHSKQALAELGFAEQNIRTMAMPQTVGTAESAKEWVKQTVRLLEEGEDDA